MDTLLKAQRLPPEQAVKFFRQKMDIPTAKWGEISSAGYAKSFAVAGAMEEALLKDFRTATQKAIEHGTGLKEFQADFDKIVSKYGWDYHGSRKWRSTIIYQTNMAAAYSAGRWQMQNTDAAKEMFPYLQYQHHNCVNPRPEHVAWNGIILPRYDPFWASHYPPNGWGCHCSVRMLSLGMMQRRGLSVSPSPVIETFPWKNPATGLITHIPKGIDPGFQTNIGMEWQKLGRERTTKGLRTVHYVPKMPEGTEAEKTSNGLKTPFERQSKDIRNLLKPKATGAVTAGIVPQTIQTLLKSRVGDVTFSKEILDKNRTRYPDVEESDYEKLPEMLDSPSYVLQGADDLSLSLLYDEAQKGGYVVSLRRSKDGKENFLLSLSKLGKKALKNLLREGTILFREQDQ